jgi:hypothetical protein
MLQTHGQYRKQLLGQAHGVQELQQRIKTQALHAGELLDNHPLDAQQYFQKMELL